jgi:hypothetical protein
VGLKPISFLASLLVLAACSSPEINRTRGGGPGADIGNRTKFVRMHEGADPFANTPRMIPGQSAPLTGARQADELSRR